jgi:hypothetical protein
LPIDRDSVRRQLGFAALAANSLDGSSDRDFLLEFVFDLSVIAVHLSGWAEEWVLWATTEFNFLELPDAFCTGSSIMPHKKNPDVLELIRGKSSRVVADLQQLLVLVKGLPLAYNRDLQEDKHALFDAFDTVDLSLELAAALIRETRFRRESIASRLEDGHLDATTLMEHLIAQGVPQAGPPVRGAPLPFVRIASRGLRKSAFRPDAGGIQGVGCSQCAGGVPQCRIDGARGGGQAASGLEATAGRRRKYPLRTIGRLSRHVIVCRKIPRTVHGPLPLPRAGTPL